jgi:hypothetical protein
MDRAEQSTLGVPVSMLADQRQVEQVDEGVLELNGDGLPSAVNGMWKLVVISAPCFGLVRRASRGSALRAMGGDVYLAPAGPGTCRDQRGQPTSFDWLPRR